MNATEPHQWLVNIGSDNGLIPSRNKPLAVSMLTHLYVAIWCHDAALSWLVETFNEIKQFWRWKIISNFGTNSMIYATTFAHPFVLNVLLIYNQSLEYSYRITYNIQVGFIIVHATYCQWLSDYRKAHQKMACLAYSYRMSHKICPRLYCGLFSEGLCCCKCID